MPFAKLPDAQLHYEWNGPEHAPVLLFSNSLGATLQMWEPQLVDFTKHFRVLRYDTRGHGQSSISPGPYTIEQLSNDVLHLLDALKLQQISFCGLSMGGMTGMHLGAHSPERFHKMVLCNTAAKLGTTEMWNTRIKTVNEAGMQAVAPSIIERWFTFAYRAACTEETAAFLVDLERANPPGYVANCAAIRDANEIHNLQQIKVSTLVVSGTHDPVTPPAEGHFLADNIPGARFIELSAAHLSNIEAQSDFNREVLQFLRA
jgi:3-oxoadipate enol-lactonase